MTQIVYLEEDFAFGKQIPHTRFLQKGISVCTPRPTPVVTEDFVVRIPDGIELDVTAPLLCAGITTYSPLRHWGAAPGKNVAVVGLGGLGHISMINQNHNSQITTNEGKYGWMVYPDGDYYIIGEKDGFVVYDSRQDQRNEKQGDTSYIQNGWIHVGQTVVQYNFQMQPNVVSQAVYQPYITGYPDGTFLPDQNITRAELATLLSRIIPNSTVTASVTLTD